MSVNTASNGPGRLLLMPSERVVDRRKSITFELAGNNLTPKLTRKASGEAYLTTGRLIFLCSDSEDLHSFSADFPSLSSVELEQPLFGANFIKCIVRAEPGGGWEGTAKLKLTFSSGGAIEFGKKLLRMIQGGPPPVELPPTYDTFDYNPYGAPPAPYGAPPAPYGAPPYGPAGYAPYGPPGAAPPYAAPPPGYSAAAPPPGYTAPPNYVYDAGPSSSGAGASTNAGASQAMYSDSSNTVYVHNSNTINENASNASAPPAEDKKTK